MSRTSFAIRSVLISLLSFIATGLYAQQTPFETSQGKASATYFEAIDFYKQLAAKYETIYMEELGPTDAGYPLNVVYYSNDAMFDAAQWRKDGKVILLINNGIHPGEPDGVDACMMLLRDAASGKIKIPDNVALAVIPIYNIGGALNRGSYSRANQNGPEAYGFRGNSQNLDLNRDFIKADAKETRSLETLFRKLDPDVFIDNHVSDGADYQHIVTVLATQHDKLGGEVGAYMHTTFEPFLYTDMKNKGYDLVPYVNDFDQTPDKGWTEFYDPPRFSSGYAALFQTFAFVPETHMLKPFKDRVLGTYALMQSFIKVASEHATDIKTARTHDRENLLTQKQFTLQWRADTTRVDKVTFKGYEAGYKTSKVSGQPRLYYDHEKPFTKEVNFYDHYVSVQSVNAPTAYTIPQAYEAVIQRLKWNGAEMYRLKHDTTMQVTAYRIESYESAAKPYEKHYNHKNIIVEANRTTVKLQKGDYIIPTNQPEKRYIIETLEPTGPDGFFAWNFFDGVLQQKEYYSDYVFEDKAAKLLEHNPSLQKLLDDKRNNDSKFASDGAAQLDFVYRHSPYYEPTHMRYPVFRIE